MGKQVLESVTTKSLRVMKNIYYIKLQVNPLAHTKSPGDYLVLTENKRYIIECKEIDMRKRINNTWRFERLTQEEDLLLFEKTHLNNNAYILIMFRKRMIRTSSIFFIPIEKYILIKKYWEKKSMKLTDFEREFLLYKCDVRPGGLIKIQLI